MNVDELIALASAEPSRRARRRRVLLPQRLPKGGLPIAELFELPRAAQEEIVEYRHLLGAGAAPEEMEAWKAAHAEYRLPRDLEAVVARINGIHLWADTRDGRSYVGLAPISEWIPLADRLHGGGDDRSLMAGLLALTYHRDSAAYVALDTDAAAYYLVDSAGVDRSCLVGRTADDLLDWLWEHRLPPLAAEP